ncbi:hypothetical protein ASPZODRAFT_19734 [Penicilliopsis zonata CBS 506.65]|uniref:Uncharacterized protein n=1 Tax=Penicilliopsis zonata CBS 506.65 TaxID=1073090 RepID=A0A1L9S766_9EURO|nr:hypothetical protein ASPZODRAFT_19734 [Penicilliopsis zonata CBS 506.65]OJJ43027.1 hypothetical protein ASPZODRAFT_19734 [Penicilliopsis zonata CBS 506.65]
MMDLETKAHRQFDEMARQGGILYEDTPAELYTHNNFPFEFRIVPYFTRKPILPADASRRTATRSPFLNPPPDEIVAHLGDDDTHILLLNKYSCYAPSLVVVTREFAVQSDDLDAADFAVAWALLGEFTRHDMFLVYNCGVNSGASQGHKHMQLLPLPGYTLWPKAGLETTTSPPGTVLSSIPNVPFVHFVARIEDADDDADVYALYVRLLGLTRQALAAAGDSRDYNLAMTREWMALIPRTTAGPEGPWGANTMGMLGMVAVRSEAERKRWAELGYTHYLAWLGIPIDSSSTP